MKKLDKNGFMLAETLVVSTVLLIVFTYLYVQFFDVLRKYTIYSDYDNIDKLYNTYNIKEFVKSDNIIDLINELNTNTAANTPYVDVTDCSSFSEFNYCGNLFSQFDVERIIFTKYDLSAFKNWNTVNNDFDIRLKTYINTLQANYGELYNDYYRLIIKYKDGSYSTGRIATGDTEEGNYEWSDWETTGSTTTINYLSSMYFDGVDDYVDLGIGTGYKYFAGKNKIEAYASGYIGTINVDYAMIFNFTMPGSNTLFGVNVMDDQTIRIGGRSSNSDAYQAALSTVKYENQRFNFKAEMYLGSSPYIKLTDLDTGVVIAQNISPTFSSSTFNSTGTATLIDSIGDMWGDRNFFNGSIDTISFKANDETVLSYDFSKYADTTLIDLADNKNGDIKKITRRYYPYPKDYKNDGYISFDGVNDYINMGIGTGAGLYNGKNKAEVYVSGYVGSKADTQRIFDFIVPGSSGSLFAIDIMPDKTVRIGGRSAASDAFQSATSSVTYENKSFSFKGELYLGSQPYIKLTDLTTGNVIAQNLAPTFVSTSFSLGGAASYGDSIGAYTGSQTFFNGKINSLLFTDGNNKLLEYEFNEGTGNILTDYVGNRNGVVVDGTWGYTTSSNPNMLKDLTNLKVEDYYDSHLKFDGADDYVQLPTLPATIDFAHGFTIEFTAKWNSLGNWSRIFDFGNGSAADNIVISNVGTVNSIGFSVYNGATGYNTVIDNCITVGEVADWKIIVDTSRNLSLYKNGNLIATRVVDFLPINTARTTNYIGKSNWTNPILNGSVYELKITETDGDVALWYKFDEETGSVLTDYGNNKLNGNIVGATWSNASDTDGKVVTGINGTYEVQSRVNLYRYYSYGLDFDGVDDYVDVGTLPATIDFAHGFTIEFTAKWDSLGNWSRIFDFGNGAGSDNIFIANATTTPNVSFWMFNGTTADAFDITNSITLGEYANWKIEVTSARLVTIYKNGVVIGSKTFSVMPNNIQRTTNYLGKSNWGNAPLDASIYEFKITEADGDVPLWYKFDEGTGSVLTDYSNNKLNGNILGATWSNGDLTLNNLKYTLNNSVNSDVTFSYRHRLLPEYSVNSITKKVYNFGHSGSYQTFTVPITGTYKVELWGAQGGASGAYIGGNGGYTSGMIHLTKDTPLYLYVGGSPTSGSKYNGGGPGGAYGNAGGGATDIRLSPTKKIRYIRDYVNGSTANAGDHWVEIKAIDINGNNVALSKTVTSDVAMTNPSVIVDGSTPTAGAGMYGYTNENGLHYVEIDLGAEYYVYSVKVWHYYDGRTYYNTKTVVYNADRSFSETVFDSATSGTYAETPVGRAYSANNGSLRSRIMIAAGGGGAGARGEGYGDGNGGYGGGLTGANGQLVNSTVAYGSYPGYGATQIAGGSINVYNNVSGNIVTVDYIGTFGAGGGTIYVGGGAGYYGGGGMSHGGGGGGSSFISGYTGCNAVNASGAHTGQPNHYSGYTFSSSLMIAGNSSMPKPTGGTETGHTGNGYGRITLVNAD